jgi:two-component system, LytTR family, sensor kinase
MVSNIFPHFCILIMRPILPPDSETPHLIAQLEHALYAEQARTHDLVRVLELVDTSALASDLQARYQAAMGFYQNLNGQLGLAEKCYKRALEIAKTSDDTMTKCHLLAHLAGVQINQGKFQEAEKQLDEAVQGLKKHAPATDLALIQCRRAFIMLHYTRFDQAMALFLESLDTLRPVTPYTLPEAYVASLAWSGLGDVYMRTGDKAKYKHATQNCLTICERAGLQVRIGWHYLNMGTCYLNEDNLVLAKEFFQKALLYADHRFVHANANANLGIALMRESQYQLAFGHFDAAEQAYGTPVTPEDFSNTSVLDLFRGEIHLARGDFQEGERHLVAAFTSGMRGDNRRHIINVAKRLSDIYASKEDFQKAFTYLRHSEEITVEYSERLREEKIRELQIKHDAIQKEKETALVKSELAALQLRSLRAQFNPHFLFNALNGLANMISAGRNDEAGEALVEFSNLLRMSLNLSEQEWIPLAKELEFAHLYIDVQKRLKFRGNLFPVIDIPKQVENMHYLIPSMMLQPFIENAVEHGLSPKDGGRILIQFERTEPGVLTCIIEDDGIGLNAARKLNERNLTKHKSLGMQFTTDRLKMLLDMNGSKAIPLTLSDLMETEQRPGTRVVLQIPVRK